MTLAMLFAVLVVLQIVDGWTTIAMLRHGGRELNSIMAFAIQCVGRDRAVVLTKLTVVAVGWALLFEPRAEIALGVLVLAYAAVAWWNLHQMRKAGLL